MIGHACLRTLQLLRAPTLLRDYDMLENAMGMHLPQKQTLWERIIPERYRRLSYFVASERGYLDAVLDESVVHPFRLVFRWCDQMEHRWTDFLSGGESRESNSSIGNLHTEEIGE